MTSIEWLIEQCPRINTIASSELIERAKELHKQEIIEAYEVGNNDYANFSYVATSGEDYFGVRFENKE